MSDRIQYLIKIAEILSYKYGQPLATDPPAAISLIDRRYVPPHPIDPEKKFSIPEEVLLKGLKSLLGENTFTVVDYASWLDNNISRMGHMRIQIATVTNIKGERVLHVSSGVYGRNYLIISPKKLNMNDERDDGTLTSSDILNGIGGIPNLYQYYFSGDSKPYTLPLFDARTAQDYFIIEMLQDRFGVKLDNPDHANEVSEFIRNNSAKINEIRRLFQRQPKRLGTGADGTAFAISDTMVLKIFSNKFAYTSAIEAINRLHSKEQSEIAKTEAMIYDAGILGQFRDKEIYYYLIEKMLPIEGLSGEYRQIEFSLAGALPSIVSMTKRRSFMLRAYWDDDPEKQKEIKTFIKMQIPEIVRDLYTTNPHMRELLEKIDRADKLARNWLPLFIEEVFYKVFTRREDLHTGNVGINNQGQLRFFDPAYKAW